MVACMFKDTSRVENAMWTLVRRDGATRLCMAKILERHQASQRSVIRNGNWTEHISRARGCVKDRYSLVLPMVPPNQWGQGEFQKSLCHLNQFARMKAGFARDSEAQAPHQLDQRTDEQILNA